tara:strand:+ start:874 stop:2343 length:1470 start_codon:yes stop_codon:yes gene_type:complete
VSIQINRSQIKDSAINIDKLDLSTGSFDFTTAGVTVLVSNIGPSSSAQQAANKAYVDSIAQGLHWKDSVVAATTHVIYGAAATLTISESATGPKNIDGVAGITNMRVLIRAQPTGKNAQATFVATSVPSAGTCIKTTLYDGANSTYTVNFATSGGTGNSFVSKIATIDISADDTAEKVRTRLKALWTTITNYTGDKSASDAWIRSDNQVDNTYNISVAQDAYAGSPFIQAGSTKRAQGNGIYIITTLGAAGVTQVYTRSTDADTNSELPGAAVFVKEGTNYADTGWVCTNDNPNLGATDIAFVQFTGAGQLTAGNGIDIAGNTVSVKLEGSNPGLQFNNGFLDTKIKSTGGLVTDGSGLMIKLEGPTLTTSNMGLKVSDGQIDTTQLADDGVTIQKAGFRWHSQNWTVGGTTQNTLQLNAAVANPNMRGSENFLVSRNGQMLKSTGITVSGTGVFDGTFGSTSDGAGNITLHFNGYLENSDVVVIKFLK